MIIDVKRDAGTRELPKGTARSPYGRALVFVIALVLGVVPFLVAVPVAEAHQQSVPAPTAGQVVSDVPSAMTPQVDDGEVWSVAQVGNTLVFGGNFTSVGGNARNRIAAVNATTGALSTTFTPDINGQVYNVLPGPNDHSVYVAGAFTQVSGTAAQYLTLLDTNTGQIVTSFKPPAFNYGMVRDIAKVGNRLFVAGFFTAVGGVAHGGLAALNATTGALDPFMNVQLAGHHNDSGSGAQGWIGPWALDVNSQGTRLVVIGNFKTADGLLRDQVVMIDIDGSSAAVDPNWATNRYSPYCFNWAFDSYVRGVTFSPDGSYFVVNATGGGNRGTLCDATARFETASAGTDIQPTWVDETGGDTVWGVTITDNVVYIGGHNRWNNNPLGSDQALPGAVPRPGMAALDPVSGRPYSWNPGHKPLGVAVYAYLATDKGLWMGYDNNYIGNYKYLRKKLVFFPYAGGSTPASTSVGQLPGSVYLADYSSNGPTNVMYRVDAGGPQVASTDGGPAWDAADGTNPSQYVNQGNSADYSPIANVDSSVPSSTPSSIFDHEFWSSTDNPPMTWTFPVTAGTQTKVRLYFANRYAGTSQVGQRVFNVLINGDTVLPNYDIVADVGDQTGVMKSFNITAPANGKITVSLTHVTENPLINGIEILNADVPAPPPASDNLRAIGFDGTTATTAQPVADTTIEWGKMRGAFTVGNQLYFGYSDGYLYRSTINGSSIGTPTKVDPYHDPLWANVDAQNGTTFDGALPTFYSQIPSVTGMFYSAGKLYFTLNGDPKLYWAWFSPDSGIVDNTEFTATSGVNFSQADGMFVSGNTLYYVNRSDESLYSVSFSNGTVGSSPTKIDGPSSGGNDWTNGAMYFVASPPANQPPTAAFSQTCVAGGCAFDASGSSDPDGSISSYEWDFGDNTTGTGMTTSHTFAAVGSYTVKLKVTDNSGASNTVSHTVQVTSVDNQISFVGANHGAAGSSTSKSVKIPEGASVGDTMLLVTTSSTGVTWTGPGSGWTRVGNPTTNVSIVSTAWVKTVEAGEPGTNVTFTGSATGKLALSLSVYSGVSTSNPVDAFAQSGDSGGTSHTTPNVVATANGDWVVSVWTDKSAGVSQWTAPASVTQRDTVTDTGTSGRMSFVLADSAGPVGTGTYGGLTATTDTSSDKAIMWTFALKRGTGNQSPSAAFTSSCDANTCSFDASGSSDPDGSISSYEWDFGDNTTGTGKTPSHTYAAVGSYTAKLKVTDNSGASDTVSHTVQVTSVDNRIGFVDASHGSATSSTSKSVKIPDGASVGDTMLLVMTSPTSVTWTGPGSGWTRVGNPTTNVSIVSTAWVKTVEAGEPGTNVTFTGSATGKLALSLSVYSGVSTSNPVDAFAQSGDAGGTSHTTPTVTATNGDWVVSVWTDKSSGVEQWTAPGSVTQRDVMTGTGGSGRMSFVLADSAGPVGAGTYGGLTATTDTSSDKAIMWTFALKPA